MAFQVWGYILASFLVLGAMKALTAKGEELEARTSRIGAETKHVEAQTRMVEAQANRFEDENEVEAERRKGGTLATGPE